MIAATSHRIEDRKSFEQLKTTLHRRLVDAVDLSRSSHLDESELHSQLRALAEYVCSSEQAHVPPEWREAMAGELLDEIYGFGPLECLMNDPEVSDVLVNGPDSVWVERNGLLEETDVRFADENHLLRLIHRLVGRAGRRIDESCPMVEARLPDGSRLNAVLPPLARRGPTLSLRRFTVDVLELEDMVRLGSLAPEMADFLAAAVTARLNILVTGGSGAGKTTLLNNLCRFIPRGDRIATAERTAELQLGQSDVVSLETKPAGIGGGSEVTLRELIKRSLRMRPDRIILGEARGDELLELLPAIRAGQSGSMFTIQANDPRHALERLEQMIQVAADEIPPFAARETVASAVQIVTHIARLAGGERKVLRISEVCGCSDGDYRIEDIFVCRQAGSLSNGRTFSAFYATGYEPRLLPDLKTLGYETAHELFVPRELGVSHSGSGDPGSIEEFLIQNGVEWASPASR